MLWTLENILAATNARIVARGADAPVAGIAIDTRHLAAREFFVAIAGAHFDGHNFIAAAKSAGAVGCLVQRCDDTLRAAAGDLWILQVPDTLVALGQLAHWWRAQHTGAQYVGITGSNGKSTTKEMVASIAQSRGAVLKTEGNFNNLIGLPLTLLRLNESHRTAVIEMGMSAAGEIAALTDCLVPDIGVITNVTAAHLETLRTVENVAQAKGELFTHMRSTGTIVVNAEDPWVTQVASGFAGRVLSFGMGNTCDVQFGRMISEGFTGTDLRLYIFGREYHTQIPVPGTHNVMNALAATAVGIALGIDPNAMMELLPTFRPMRMRMERVQLENGVQVINDSYNANPESMQAALRTVGAAKRAGRFLAVLGDMLELGEQADECHATLGRRAVASGVDHLFVMGSYADNVVSGAADAGMPSEKIYATPEDRDWLQSSLLATVQPGDVVLVKGSRGMAMEQIVEFLKTQIGVC